MEVPIKELILFVPRGVLRQLVTAGLTEPKDPKASDHPKLVETEVSHCHPKEPTELRASILC